MIKARLVLVGFWIGFLIIPQVSLSQIDSVFRKKEVTDCEASLAIAAGEFNAGRFFSLPAILKRCLEKGFTKEQKVRAYMLLCQVYLINDSPSEAEASYLKLLKADPEYIANPNTDPVDVVYLSKKFTTRPIFTPHLKVGINTSFTSLIQPFSTNSKPDSVKISSGLKPGWSFGGGLDWNVSDRVSLSGDLTVSKRTFEKEEKSIFRLDETVEIADLVWMDVPIYLKYQGVTGLLRPYAYAGYAYHIRISSAAQLTYNNIKEDGSQAPTNGDVNFSSRQSLLNRSFIIGGGVKYKTGKNYVFADLRMQLGLSNVTIASKSIDLLNTTTYSYINDLYRVNSITFSVGYIIPDYNPRKIGGWQPKGFLGKILYGNKATTQ